MLAEITAVKMSDDSLLRLLLITSHKPDLHVIYVISNIGGIMFLLHHELRDYSLVFLSFICYHTAALPCKRVVNKHL